MFNNGFIEQVGTPYDIYNQSATQFVCDFIGSINKISQEVLKNYKARINTLKKLKDTYA